MVCFQKHDENISNEVFCYRDSDRCDDKRDRKSTVRRYVFMACGAAPSSCYKKEAVVALSSSEAEHCNLNGNLFSLVA